MSEQVQIVGDYYIIRSRVGRFKSVQFKSLISFAI